MARTLLYSGIAFLAFAALAFAMVVGLVVQAVIRDYRAGRRHAINRIRALRR